jgi:BASS family bile acid:Na+ symporter
VFNPALVTFVVPAALMVLMLGLGLSLEWHDFVDTFRARRVLLLGLAAQFLLLPALGVVVARASGLDPLLALGLVVLTLCPGGALSSTICNLLKLDLALSVSLTALSSMVTPFSIPLLYGWAASLWPGAAGSIELPIVPTMARLVAITIVPIAFGMLLRKYLGARAAAFEGPVRILSATLFVAVILGIVSQNLDVLANGLRRVGTSVLVVNLGAMSLAVFLSRLCKASRAASVSVGIEVGMQNAATATFITVTLLDSPEMALTAAVYASLMVPTAVLLGLLGRTWIGAPAEATTPRGGGSVPASRIS